MDRNARVDYASKEYWNERYTEEDHFEWISNGYQKQLGAIAAKGASTYDVHTRVTPKLRTYYKDKKFQIVDVIYGSPY